MIKPPDAMLTRLHRRLVFTGLLVLLGWIGWLAVLAAQDAAVLRERESAVRGQIVAEALAQSVGRALGYGIGLNELRGVEAVFAARIADNPVVREIVFDDLAGHPHFVQHSPQRVGLAVSAAVRSGHAVFGRVTVYLAPTPWMAVWGEPLMCIALLMLVTWLSARESLMYAIARGPGLRDAAVQRLSTQVLRLDFSQVVKSGRSRRLDMRSAGLSAQIRELNEQFTRLFRLITSLRQTEPNGDERSRLLALVVQARGAARFADGKPAVQRLDPVCVEARWLVLGAVLSMALAVFSSDLGADPAGTALLLVVGLVSAWTGHALARYGWTNRTAATVGWAGWLALLLAPLVGGVLVVMHGPGVFSGGLRLAAVGTHGLGLGLFLSGLGRVMAWSEQAWPPEAQGAAEPLAGAAGSMLGVVGAALALLLGDVLGPGGMLLLSAGVAGCVGFFFSLSAAGGSDAVEPCPPQDGRFWPRLRKPSAGVGVSAAFGLALGVVLMGVAGGCAALQGPAPFLPGVGGWIVALGLGIAAHHLPGCLPWQISRALAFTACLAVLAVAWIGDRMGGIGAAPVMHLAVACVSYHAMGVLKTLRGLTLRVGGLSAGALIAWLLPVVGALSGLASVAAGLWLLASVACVLLRPVVQPEGEGSHAA